MGLLDRNDDLVINGQRIRSYNNLKDRNRTKAKDGFLRWPSNRVTAARCKMAEKSCFRSS
jgi:hypothetical protein